jgi:hypothetical protein
LLCCYIDKPILNGPYCIKTNGSIPIHDFTCDIYKKIKNSFYNIIDDTIKNQNLINVSDIFGQSIRLAFHDAAEVDITLFFDFMGPDGCLSSDPANNGLVESTSIVNTIIEPLWQKYCDTLSRADFWVLIGKLAIEKAALPNVISIPYQYGRFDNRLCPVGGLLSAFYGLSPHSRLPFAQEGLDGTNGILNVFITRMGLTMNDAGEKDKVCYDDNKLCVFIYHNL